MHKVRFIHIFWCKNDQVNMIMEYSKKISDVTGMNNIENIRLPYF